MAELLTMSTCILRSVYAGFELCFCWLIIFNNQVHDEVILEGPTESADKALALVKQCMMYPFDGVNFLDVELAVDGKHALNWYSAK